MINLEHKLKNLETNIVEIRNHKKKIRERSENREKEIHKPIIDIWIKEVLKDKKFQSDLNKISATFKRLDTKNKRYLWKIFEFDISKKENLKDNLTFYINDDFIHFHLNLSGIDSEIIVGDASFKIEKIKKAKEYFLSSIIEIFEEQIRRYF